MKPFIFGARIGVVGACVVALAGCQYDPYADSFTTTKPKNADLIGTYALSEQTLNDTAISQLKARDGSAPTTHVLVLRSNGTFSAVNVPVWAENQAAGNWSVSGFKSFSGTWKSQVTSSVGEKNAWGLALSPDPAFSPGTITFSGGKAPYGIIVTYSDPDEGKVIIYKRTGNVIPHVGTKK